MSNMHAAPGKDTVIKTEFILKTLELSGISIDGKACFLSTVAVRKNCVWKTHVKCIATGSFITCDRFLMYFRYHLKVNFVLEKGYQSQKLFDWR